MAKEYSSFSAFYPFYLEQHANQTCRRLHVVGSTFVIAIIFYVLYTQSWSYLWLALFVGYGFAWIGHFFFEKNKPATFIYPLYSFIGDWVMFKDVVSGKIRW